MSESNDKSINEVIDDAIKAIIENTESASSGEALHLTQAALNLSHVKTVLSNLP